MRSVDEAVAIGSIFAVAGAGFRLSLVLNAVGCEVANEGLEVHSIAKVITLFSLTLKQAANVFQVRDSVHSRDAVDGVRTIANDATCIFDEFNDMLDRLQAKPTDGSAIPSIQQRFQWCFNTHRVQYLLAQLDAHKLSVLVIIKVLELGKLMASTWSNQPRTNEQAKHDLINQERLETQNVLIVRYWQMSKLSRLYEASRREGDGDRVTVYKDRRDGAQLPSRSSSSHQTVYATTVVLPELSNYSLGELDQNLHRIKQSPREMVRVSSEVINPLLDRWTRWEEVQQRRQWRDSRGHNAPSVDQVNEDEDDWQYYERYREREQSPKGVYLEGTTTDWRKPHSVAALEEAKRRRQKYKAFQPTATAVSSDEDNSADSTRYKQRKAQHHLIESTSGSSTSEDESPRYRAAHARRSVASRRNMHHERPPANHPASTTQAAPPPLAPTPGVPLSPQRPQAGLSPHLHPNAAYHPSGRRELDAMQRSNSAPVQLSHLAHEQHVYQEPQQRKQPQQPYPITPPNAGQVYLQPPMHSPHAPHLPHSPHSTAQAWYTPHGPGYTRMAPPSRAASQDTARRGRYPSRNASPLGPHSSARYSLSGSTTRPGPGPEYAGPAEDSRKQGAKENLREGATKGLLGAGAIAGFFEALEALSF